MLNHLSSDRSDFGVILDARTGKALSAFRVNNPLRTAVADGHGGWYVGGGFIHVNGVLRKRLAHIDRSGRLDRDWRPEANGNGVSVTSLARIGSRLYIAGDFGQLNRRSSVHLGVIDTGTGKFDQDWRPPQDRPFWNNVLLPAGRRLIVGGGGGSDLLSGVVALDAETGEIDRSWSARVDTNELEGGGVYLLARSGRHLLVGGTFKAVDGVPRSSLAALDEGTGALDRTWSLPSLGALKCYSCATVSAVAAGARHLYVSVNGPAKYALVALDPATGRVQRVWRARLDFTTALYGGSFVNALEVVGSRVYIAGSFDRINGSKRRAFAALDSQTARVLPSWNPQANTAYASVFALSDSRLLVGIELSREVSFDFSGLKTFKPVRQLKLRLALSGPGTVRVGIGRRCNYRRWTETARCSGTVFRWLDSIRFPRAERRPYDRSLGSLDAGHYFVRFVPRASGGAAQPPYDFPIKVLPPKVRSTFGG